MHHPPNMTTSMVGLINSHTQKSHPKMVNPRDIAGEGKEEEEETHTHTKHFIGHLCQKTAISVITGWPGVNVQGLDETAS